MENDIILPKHLANPYENYDQWFNDILFSDLKVFVSTDSGSAFFNCHKYFIQRRSPTFLAELLQRKIEENNGDNIDRVVIISDLENDVDLTRSFLSMFYMGHEAYSAIQYNIASNNKEKLEELCEKYNLYCAVKPPNPAVETIKVAVPVPNRITLHGDIIISIKGTNNNFLCHKVVLVHYSDYFRAMFASEMKEKSAEKVVLDITGFMEDDQKSPLFQLFLESVYTGNEPKFPSIELAMHADQLAEQYFCPMLANHCANYLHNQITPKTIVEFISTALRLERYDFVESATDYFVPNIVTIALQENFWELPLDYVLNLEFDFKNTIYHHCILESTNDNACLNAIKKLEEMIGKDSRVNILATNANYDSTAHFAAYSARPKTLKYLIKKGVDVHEVNAKDMTALDYILEQKFHKKWIPVVNVLVENGAQSKPTDPSELYKYAAHCNPFFEKYQDLWPKYQQLLAQNPPLDVDREDEYVQNSLNCFQEALNVRNFTMIKRMVNQLRIPLKFRLNAHYKESNWKAKIQTEENSCVIIVRGRNDEIADNFWVAPTLLGPQTEIPLNWSNFHIGKINFEEEFVRSKHGSTFAVTLEPTHLILTLYDAKNHDHFVFTCSKDDVHYANLLWYLWIDHNVKEECKERMFLQDIPQDETLPTGVLTPVINNFGWAFNVFPRITVTELSQEMREQTDCNIS
jgi:hypothetical protein